MIITDLKRLMRDKASVSWERLHVLRAPRGFEETQILTGTYPGFLSGGGGTAERDPEARGGGP